METKGILANCSTIESNSLLEQEPVRELNQQTAPSRLSEETKL